MDKQTRTQSMMLWLEKNVPESAHKLKEISAIHGKDAFKMASEALQAFGQYNKRITGKI